MIHTIDASVWVAWGNQYEKQHQDSAKYITELGKSGLQIICPTLCLAEVVAAIVRPSGDLLLGQEMSRRVRRFPNVRLKSLTIERSKQTERIAADLRLRGADAVYVALAAEFGATLITWDVDVITRAASTVSVQTPTDWLATLPSASP